jgi:alkylation response protein AidB-like acyl-CoA dehydrogenase
VTTSRAESVEAFRARAREWIRENLRPLELGEPAAQAVGRLSDEAELSAVAHERALQRKLFDGGLAGICVPKEYGGQGLTPAHQQALNEEVTGFELPLRIQVPTFSPCAAVILEFGTERQKQLHLPAILKGEELWMQFLSEPSGGSDVAGALTSAVRDGDAWVMNGSKVWTTGAWWSDWALCLARTNWEVPKHRGLTVFMLPIRQRGIEVHRIEMLNGSREFCQEFITDVIVPDSDRIGEVDDGWTVGRRWMTHERMLYNSPFVTSPVGPLRGGLGGAKVSSVARSVGREDCARTHDLVGEAHVLDLVGAALAQRIGDGITSGQISDQASAIVRLFTAVAGSRIWTLRFEAAGTAGAVWDDQDGDAAYSGRDYLMRQASCIGGGTTEMARNVISERVLGMPREQSSDRDVAFRDVPRGRSHHW